MPMLLSEILWDRTSLYSNGLELSAYFAVQMEELL